METTPIVIEPLLNTIKSEYYINQKPNLSKSKEYIKMVNSLREMGFSAELIDMTFCFFNVNNIEQAVLIMSKEDGVWQHNYIQGEDDGKCLVCVENADHLDYKRKIENIIINSNINDNEINLKLKKSVEILRDSLNSNSSENSKNDNKIINDQICLVCESTLETNPTQSFSLKCGHTFCLDCWTFYLEQKISSSEVSNIHCMMKDCKLLIDENSIKELINEELFNKFKKFKMDREVLINKNMKFCPEINCGGYGIKNNTTSFISCTNGHNFCFDCMKNWHQDRNCEEIIDEDFKKWRVGKYVKKCPHCKFWTEKNDGCNHMTCKACEMEWCWLCGGEYLSGHYGAGGACYGLQYSKI